MVTVKLLLKAAGNILPEMPKLSGLSGLQILLRQCRLGKDESGLVWCLTHF